MGFEVVVTHYNSGREGVMKKACRVLVMVGAGVAAWTGAAVAGDDGNKSADKSRDARLEAKLDADIQKDERLAGRVDAQARAGKMTITGSVETEADKVRAGQLARTSGARTIDNQVTVTSTAQPSATPEPAPGEIRPLSDPRRKDPLVGTMPAEQTGSREIRLRTMGMDDPKVKKQQEKQKQQEQKAERERAEQAASPASR
jgi:hypothetical protein